MYIASGRRQMAQDANKMGLTGKVEFPTDPLRKKMEVAMANLSKSEGLEIINFKNTFLENIGEECSDTGVKLTRDMVKGLCYLLLTEV